MENITIISVQQLCTHYDIPVSFVESLSDYDLIEVVQHGGTQYIQSEQIRMIEKLIRLHYDLEINVEGLDVVSNLIEQIQELKNEVNLLKNELRFYK